MLLLITFLILISPAPSSPKKNNQPYPTSNTYYIQVDMSYTETELVKPALPVTFQQNCCYYINNLLT